MMPANTVQFFATGMLKYNNYTLAFQWQKTAQCSAVFSAVFSAGSSGGGGEFRFLSHIEEIAIPQKSCLNFPLPVFSYALFNNI